MMKLKKMLFKFFSFGSMTTAKKKLLPPPPPVKAGRRRLKVKIDEHNIEQGAREIINRLQQNAHLFPSPPVDLAIDLVEELRLIEPFVQSQQMYALRQSIRRELVAEVRKIAQYLNDRINT